MTACTDDERRRVAERLRGISRDVRFWGGDEYDLCPECARKAPAAVAHLAGEPCADQVCEEVQR